jgi:hypothetical protein
MKKSFIILALAIGALANAQCRVGFHESQGDVFFTPHYGVTNTLGVDLAIRITDFRLGAGTSILIDNTEREQDGITYKKSEWSIYGTGGVRVYDVVLGGRVGVIKSEPNEFNINGIPQQLPNSSRTLYGGYIGYFVKNNISVNGGWDNMAEWNLGVSFGF